MTVEMMKKIPLLCILVVFACMNPSQARCAPEKNARNVYFQALQSIENGNFLKGIQLYYRFLLLGDISLSKAVRAHDLDKAILFLKTEFAGKKLVEKAALAVVMIDRILERLDKADKRLNALREKYPSSVLLAFIQWELLLTMGEQDQAKQIFEAMKKLPDPRGFPALADHLLMLRGEGNMSDPARRRKFLMEIAFRRWDEMDFAGATNVFREIMSEFPKNPEAPRALVDLLIQIDKADEAIQIVDTWSGSSTEPLLAPLPLARIRYSQGRFEEVIELLTPLLQADPQDLYLRLMIAESFFHIEQYASAGSQYELLAEADRKNQGFLQRLIACLAATGRIEEVLPRLEVYVKVNSSDSAMRAELASILFRLGKFDDANVQYSFLSEVGNPYRELALEQISIIDQMKNARVFKTDMTNAPGVPSTTYHSPEGTSKVLPEPSPFIERQKPAHIVNKMEMEQIQRMKELFK